MGVLAKDASRPRDQRVVRWLLRDRQDDGGRGDRERTSPGPLSDRSGRACQQVHRGDEKNLQRLFNAAEGTGAILLFDEADAVFGRRSEVRDSHDRYANIEISYLLQRIETYHGLAILTTNQKQAIDPAFLRRIRFIVHFPFPDANQREAIWNRVFPTSTPTCELNSRRLAQLSIAGGHIRNVAMAGAFIAADRGEPIRMDHLAEAARTEYAKLEQPLSDAELRGWA